jgi:hypothetical protein
MPLFILICRVPRRVLPNVARIPLWGLADFFGLFFLPIMGYVTFQL